MNRVRELAEEVNEKVGGKNTRSKNALDLADASAQLVIHQSKRKDMVRNSNTLSIERLTQTTTTLAAAVKAEKEAVTVLPMPREEKPAETTRAAGAAPAATKPSAPARATPERAGTPPEGGVPEDLEAALRLFQDMAGQVSDAPLSASLNKKKVAAGVKGAA